MKKRGDFMHIGIIQYKNKIIYVDLKDNKIYGYYYHNNRKKSSA